MLIPAKTRLDCQTILGVRPSENTCNIYIYLYIYIYVRVCVFLMYLHIVYVILYIVVKYMLKR